MKVHYKVYWRKIFKVEHGMCPAYTFEEAMELYTAFVSTPDVTNVRVEMIIIGDTHVWTRPPPHVKKELDEALKEMKYEG